MMEQRDRVFKGHAHERKMLEKLGRKIFLLTFGARLHTDMHVYRT